jgi:hypothetical protein
MKKVTEIDILKKIHPQKLIRTNEFKAVSSWLFLVGESFFLILV